MHFKNCRQELCLSFFLRNIVLLLLSGVMFGEEVCTTTNSKVLEEAHLSFPSGHSALSFYTAIFLILYAQTHISFARLAITRKRVFQCTMVVMAMYVCNSRVKDNWHHPTDVFGGIVIGFLIGVIVHDYVLPLVDRK